MGECQEQIEAKALAVATGLDVKKVCGSDQWCAVGKAAIYAMRGLFEADGSEGLLLVDASNAFTTH